MMEDDAVPEDIVDFKLDELDGDDLYVLQAIRSCRRGIHQAGTTQSEERIFACTGGDQAHTIGAVGNRRIFRGG